jgi:DNA (cytosine-5)-methyltransferase 1
MTSKTNRSNPQPGDPCHTLTKGAHAPAILLPGTFVERAGSGHGGKGILIQDDQASTLQAQHVQKCFYIDVVRRLTPLECERLQGLPDGYTHRAGLSDTARYSAIGNGMTVQVIRWLGERIEKVQSVLNELES